MGKLNISTEAFVKPQSANAWAEDIAELNDAIKAKPGIFATLTVDAKDEGKELRAIRDAAKALDRTVRILKRDDANAEVAEVKDNGRKVYKGTVDLTITLAEKYAEGRGRKPAAESTVPAKSTK